MAARCRSILSLAVLLASAACGPAVRQPAVNAEAGSTSLRLHLTEPQVLLVLGITAAGSVQILSAEDALLAAGSHQVALDPQGPWAVNRQPDPGAWQGWDTGATQCISPESGRAPPFLTFTFPTPCVTGMTFQDVSRKDPRPTRLVLVMVPRVPSRPLDVTAVLMERPRANTANQVAGQVAERLRTALGPAATATILRSNP